MKNIEISKNKRFLLLVGISLVVVIVGVGIWYTSEQNRKNEVLASIGLIFKEDSYIEYGQDTIDFNEFIKEKNGEPEVTLPSDEIDTKVLAKHELTYKVSKDGYSKDVKLSLEVKDTKAPEINIKEETVTLEYGSDYDVNDNIESVKDPIDGDIAFAKVAGESNYYIVEGTVDTTTSNDYTITIKAMDKNKTTTEKTYTVHVNEEQVEAPIPQQPSNNGGNGNYTPPSNNAGSGNSTPPSNACVSTGFSLGNSGKQFETIQAASGWADEQIFNESSPWYMMAYVPSSTSDNCGNEVWTVHFYSR